MINDIECDLLQWMDEQQGRVGIIQQLNCFHTHGGGIARTIKAKYPSVYIADIKFGERGDFMKLGKFCVAEVLPNKFCYGYYGQYNFGAWERQTNYEAVYNGLTAIKNHASENNIEVLGLPKNMGAGLGGASWRVMRVMIQDIFESWPNDVYVCEFPTKPKSKSKDYVPDISTLWPS